MYVGWLEHPWVTIKIEGPNNQPSAASYLPAETKQYKIAIININKGTIQK